MFPGTSTLSGHVGGFVNSTSNHVNDTVNGTSTSSSYVSDPVISIPPLTSSTGDPISLATSTALPFPQAVSTAIFSSSPRRRHYYFLHSTPPSATSTAPPVANSTASSLYWYTCQQSKPFGRCEAQYIILSYIYMEGGSYRAILSAGSKLNFSC